MPPARSAAPAALDANSPLLLLSAAAPKQIETHCAHARGRAPSDTFQRRQVEFSPVEKPELLGSTGSRGLCSDAAFDWWCGSGCFSCFLCTAVHGWNVCFSVFPFKCLFPAVVLWREMGARHSFPRLLLYVNQAWEFWEKWNDSVAVESCTLAVDRIAPFVRDGSRVFKPELYSSKVHLIYPLTV